MHAFQRSRRAALELGRRLASRGLLEAPEDVFFLLIEEVEALAGGPAAGAPPADLRGLVARRRLEYEELRGRKAPDFVRSDGVPVEEDEGPAGHGPAPAGLRGIGIGGGRGEGPARILRAPDPSKMRPGDVLVVDFADPGWTPLFPRAAAIVMEVGGTMCHAAVIARELGIPAVFGVRGATGALEDGERVTVLGDEGVVLPSAGRAIA